MTFTYFDNPEFLKAVIAVMLSRYGKQRFVQIDFDTIAHRRIIEDGYEDGSLELKLETQ